VSCCFKLPVVILSPLQVELLSIKQDAVGFRVKLIEG
jgi:hypothetical protein